MVIDNEAGAGLNKYVIIYLGNYLIKSVLNFKFFTRSKAMYNKIAKYEGDNNVKNIL